MIERRGSGRVWQSLGMEPIPQDGVAVVTGAGRGIGRAVAKRLSAAGLRVALTSRSEAELKATAQVCEGQTLVVPADITDPSEVARMFDAVRQRWGRVDVLVANAGAAMSAKVEATADEDWQRMLDVNLTAPFRCMRQVIPGMVERGFGRIVVVASMAAKVGDPYVAAYTASKHGVLGLVRSAAAELARTAVTVNAVCPGFVDTPLTEQTVANIAERTGRSHAEARSVLERRQPTGRLVTVDEVTEAVWFCLRSPSLTGQGVNVDGGAVQS